MATFLKRSMLSRRAVLRGALVGGGLATVPLPRLGAMLDGHGVAYAATGRPLQRFGVYFIGNGFVPGSFAPSPRVTGPLGALTAQLAPLEKVKAKITVVSGFDLKTGRPDGLPHGHFFGALSGAHGIPTGRLFALPTIDQVIALNGPLGQGVPYKSLEVGVATATPGVGQKAYHAVSSRGPNAQNEPVFDPIAQFNKLFKSGATPTAPAAGGTSGVPAVDPTWEMDRSLLDAVREDALALQSRLGAEDRARLDAHLTGLRALEDKLKLLGTPRTGGSAACQKMDMTTPGDTSSSLSPKVAAAQDDLMVMALACDQTRVFTYQLTKPAAHVNYGLPDATGDFHGICHNDGGNDQPKVIKGVTHTMGLFAHLLEKMDSINEGAGTMLDNSTILISTCVAWGKTHCQWEWPCVIAGRGGVRLAPDGKPDPAGKYNFQGGWHYRSQTFDNFSKVLLTLANLHGAGLKEIGKDDGRVDTEIQEIRGPG
jgi:hypothetical protein